MYFCISHGYIIPIRIVVFVYIRMMADFPGTTLKCFTKTFYPFFPLPTRMAVYIHTVGMTCFGRREETLEELVFDATQKLLEEYGRKKIEALFLGCMNPEEFADMGNSSTFITDYLGLTPTPSMRIETASSTGASVFRQAVMAVKSGQYDNALVIGCEKMTHLPTSKTTRILAEVIDPIERRYGATMPALAAMATRRYMADYGMTLEELAHVAVKSHRNGALNPFAQFKKEVTLEKVMNSKVIADPLRLYDCSPVSDGACAVIVSRDKNDVKVTGTGHATDTLSLQNRDALTEFKSTRLAGKKAYETAKLGPKDIDIAEVHDAFTPFEIIGSEDLGFFEKGAGKDALVKGVTALDGDLPINPSGGLKSRGHPIGASGLAQIIEIYWQLTGNAGKRQVDGVKIGLAQSIGGLANNNLVTILERCK